VALVGFRYDLVGYELATVRLRHALADGGALPIGHQVNACQPRLDLAGVLSQFFLIFKRPMLGLPHDGF
jgi:hypothetical protein